MVRSSAAGQQTTVFEELRVQVLLNMRAGLKMRHQREGFEMAVPVISTRSLSGSSTILIAKDSSEKEKILTKKWGKNKKTFILI